MSAIATAWAWGLPLEMTKKFVLVAIAECADETEKAAPLRECLMDMTGGSETTIRAKTKELVEEGYLAVVGDVIRQDATGSNRLCTQYRLLTNRAA